LHPLEPVANAFAKGRQAFALAQSPALIAGANTVTNDGAGLGEK
jgi:hypothetical protein